MIRIAFIIGSFRRGGAERDLLELLRRLDRRRYDMRVFCAHEEGDMLEAYRATQVPTLPLGIGSIASAAGLRAVRRLRRYMRQERIRILQGFGVYGSFYAAAAGSGTPGLKVIAYEFTAIEPDSLKARLFQPWYYKRSDAIVGNSEAVLEAVRRRRGVRAGRLRLIRNGVDVSRYAGVETSGNNGQPAALQGIPAGSLVVGAVGRLHPIKGHRYLVEAWPRVRQRFPEARLLLVGPAHPHQEQEIREVAARTGVADRLVLAGLRDDVPRLLPMMDVVALPSITEGFSNVIIEAGAAGRPVVATRVGGNPEAIVEGETGLLVPARDPAALGDAIVSLLADPSRRRQMGEAARRRVHAHYTVERMVESWDQLYRDLVS